MVKRKKMEKGKTTSELSTPSGSFKMSYSNTKPSWLTSTLSDLEQRMKSFTLPEEVKSDNSFKERADFYYEKRPQLMELLQDLYNGYVALSDKYTQSLLKQNLYSKQFSLTSSVDDDFYSGQEDGSSILNDSDSESSISYHHQPLPVIPIDIKNGDDIVANLVIKNVEFNLLIDEVVEMERLGNESLRKIKLQNNLLDDLQSERLILLNENAQLCIQVTRLAQEKKRVSSESVSVKRKATQMARLLLKMRDEQRISMARKIEDLQMKVQRLEKENECYGQLVNKEHYDEFVKKESNEHSVMKGYQVKAEKRKKKEVKDVSEVDLHICLSGWNKMKISNDMKYYSTKKGSMLWRKMKNMGMF